MTVLYIMCMHAWCLQLAMLTETKAGDAVNSKALKRQLTSVQWFMLTFRLAMSSLHM